MSGGATSIVLKLAQKGLVSELFLIETGLSSRAIGGSTNITPSIGKTSVYVSYIEDGTIQFIGITDDLPSRAVARLSQKGISISAIPGLQNISRADARAVEQTLIEYYGLGKNGGALLNKINSIAVTNPIYSNSIQRGRALLRSIGYQWF
ncbi:hypothetical protein LIN78_00525 [Leeia sp. TBRC 13508]|uniref:Uncharacterized protein n=1 Tax=Leeia speluncae TaxID=2884804 RepID=A0ABS8D1H2_9NEIS|nr:hypothetical protein [Leeia speluncae]MCB6182040.1 hypothetical protein [Leeia speluncae]